MILLNLRTVKHIISIQRDSICSMFAIYDQFNAFASTCVQSAVVKELDNLRRAQVLAEQQITDSSLRTSIREEINGLLQKFRKRKRSLAKSYTASTSNSQQQHTECNKKHKKEQEHHEGQESQQQGQQSKLGEKLEKKLHKPQQKQQQKQEDKLQEKQRQSKQQHAKRLRQHTLKLPARVSSMAQNVPLRGHSGHPPNAAIHGVYHGYSVQPGWLGVHFVPPFTPQLGTPEYIIPFNPLYPHPEFNPWQQQLLHWFLSCLVKHRLGIGVQLREVAWQELCLFQQLLATCIYDVGRSLVGDLQYSSEIAQFLLQCSNRFL